MDLRISHCFIAVHDHDKALDFYRDVLGLKVRTDVEFEGMRWVTVGPPSQPDMEIVLEPPSVNPNASQADQQAIADLMAKGMMGRVVFATDDCDATFEHIQAAGAEVIEEPIDQPYGVRDCAFRDPSGNMLRVSQPRGQQSRRHSSGGQHSRRRTRRQPTARYLILDVQHSGSAKTTLKTPGGEQSCKHGWATQR